MATTSLRRTPSSAGSNTTGTVSVWVKYPFPLGDYNTIVGGNEGSSSTDRSLFSISSDGTIYNQIVHGNTAYTQESTRKLRDPAAWYHIVYQFDTSNGTQADRIKTYINNELITSWSTTASWPQNIDIKFWDSAASTEFLIGCRKSSSSYQYFFNGVMAHMHIVDGTVYAPSTFAETDTTTGEWVAKPNPTVTYGTNGSFLKFENSANMVLDSSSNAHTYTTTGSLKQTEDNPDNNFPTWNSLNRDHANTDSVFSYANNYAQAGANGAYNQAVSTQAITRGSGKWYFECKYVANDGGVGGIGIVDMDKISEIFYENRNLSDNSANTDIGRCVYYANGYSVIPGTQNTSFGGTWSTGDIIGMAVDSDNGAVYFSKNGTWQNSGDPTSGATKTGAINISAASWWTGATVFAIYCGDNSSSGNDSFAANFGNGHFQATAVSTAQSDDGSVGIFEYDVPAGYRALCTKNLATYG